MKRLGLLAAALLLSGCGGGGGDGGSKELDDIEAVSDAAGCDPSTTRAEPMMFAAETADCTVGGDEVAINWFNSNDARDQYVDLGTSNGAVYVVGDNWAIECQTTDVRDRLAKETGGSSEG